MDASRRLFLKLMGAGSAALAIGKLPEAKAKTEDFPLRSDPDIDLDFPTDIPHDMKYAESAIRIIPNHHGKIGIDVIKPISVLHLHRYMAELLDDTPSYFRVLDMISPEFSWRTTDSIFVFNSNDYTVSPRSFKNLRNAGVTYGNHKFFSIKRVGYKDGPIRVNGMPFIDCQLLHCKKFHHFTHKPFKNRPWEDIDIKRMAGIDKLYPMQYIIPV